MSWPVSTAEGIALPGKGNIVSGPFGSNISAKFFVEEGVPVIRGNNLTNGLEKFKDDGFVFLSEQKASEFSNCEAIEDDLIFTAAGTIGQVGIIPKERKYEKYIISNKQLRLRCNKEIIEPLFAFYWFSSPTMNRYIAGRNTGASIPLINLGILRKLPTPLPPLHIQRHIVSIIESYDDLIEKNRRRIQLLEESARLLYKEWFVYLRFPGHEHVKVVDGVPEGWERKPLAELTDYLSRGITPHYDDEANGLVINQKCIRNGQIDLSLARRQSKEFTPIRQVLVGDVLINSTGEGTLGRVAQVKSPIPNCTVDTHVTIVRPKAELGIHYFGMSLMALEPVFSTMGRGATNQTELSRAAIGEITILVPAYSLIRDFNEYVHPTYQQISTVTLQIQKLKQARDLLLPRLMNGEIEV